MSMEWGIVVGKFFNFDIFDVWNHPALKITREIGKAGVKVATSASAKAEYTAMIAPEMADSLYLARYGHVDNQFSVGLYYMENNDFDEAMDWMERAAKQGHTRAGELLEMLQDG